MNEFKFKDGELATLQALVGGEVGRLKNRSSELSERISSDEFKGDKWKCNEWELLIKTKKTVDQDKQKASDLWVYLTEGRRKQEEPHTVAVYREDDGHTYYFSPAENEWIAFPTFKDGTPDFLNPTALSDIELSERDLHNLKEWLSGIELDHGLRNFDPNDPEYWKESL